MGEIIGELLFSIVFEIACEIFSLFLEGITDVLSFIGDVISSAFHTAKNDSSTPEQPLELRTTKTLFSDTNIFNKESD